MKSRAFVLTKNGKSDDSFALKEIDLPEVVKKGCVRIKVSVFGINYADVMMRQGLYREAPPLPYIMGYDVEGEIIQVGEGVINYKPGDKVFALTRFGGYSEIVDVPIEGVAKLPENTPKGIGAALATQCVTAVYASDYAQTLLPGEKVLIHAAAGGVGTALIQISLSKGCEVIGVAGGKLKTEYLKRLGVHHIIDHQTTSYIDYVRSNLQGRVHCIIDAVGGKQFKEGLSILSAGGRIVSMGASSLSGKKGIFPLIKLVFGFGFFSPIRFLSKSQSLIGINMLKVADYHPQVIQYCLQLISEYYNQGVLKPHVEKVYSYTDLAKAHQDMEDRKSIGKFVISWD